MNRLSAAMLLMAAGCGLLFCGGAMETVSLENVSFNGIEELRVDASLLDVEVTGHGGDTVDMEVRMPRELSERYEVRHAQEGAALVVRVVQKKIGLLGFHGEMRIVFQIPQATGLDVVSSSGDQSVRDMVSESATLRSSSGNIHARNIAARLQTASSSGRIDLAGITGPLSVRSSSGDQNYADTTGDIAAGTSSGAITIDRHEGKLDLHSSSGDLVGREVTLTGNSLFRTSSGRIDFQLQNAMDDISFELSSSSGQLMVGGTQAEKQLTTGKYIFQFSLLDQYHGL